MKTVVLTDDHILLRNGLATLINSFENYSVLFEANNGKQLLELLDSNNVPNILLLDITMPEMDGYQTAAAINSLYPEINIVALSMLDTESAVIKMIRNGAKGYILKDCEPDELKQALEIVGNGDYFLNNQVSGKTIFSAAKSTEEIHTSLKKLTENEKEFLRLLGDEKSHKEIADVLNLSIRTIDGYRDDLFKRLNVKSRVGLVIYAIKTGLLEI